MGLDRLVVASIADNLHVKMFTEGDGAPQTSGDDAIEYCEEADSLAHQDRQGDRRRAVFQHQRARLQ